MTPSAGIDCLPDLLERWARRTPNAAAIEDSAGRALSYRQLDAAAGRVAARLHALGVRRGDRVGLCMPKSIHSVACIFGIMKARAAYVPVDYSAPPERNRFIFTNCQARVVCADEPRAAALSAGGAPAPMIVFPGESTEARPCPELEGLPPDWRSDEPAALDDLAYILYTSGSTGVPKGVMHAHRSALSFVRWCHDVFEPTADDRISSHAPFHFDLSIHDLYVPMTVGAAIILVEDALGKEPHQLGPYIAEKRISIWYSVPSILALLAQYGKLDQCDCSALRLVLFAGEVFPIKQLRALKKLWPDKTCYNLYGPTETNVCTYFRIPDEIEEDRTTPYPIGVTCENCESIVLDENDRPVSTDGEGLLLIRQSGPVMLGYWNLPEQSAKCFWTDEQGATWYRTGDVVHRDANGDFIFVGRRDRMVKRRGYRIELGEIESALYRHPQVREAAAISVPDAEAGVRIVACLTPHPGEKLSIIQLKQFCAQNLPQYMIPDLFQFFDKLPRTSTDKVDYQSLIHAAK
ncbi:MAG: amino acid adenylation domain-containing protein [Phycisphaerae bacterium]|nr:amino acid adenylation domain-containing protein [Phycisphaerae bacterium]NUQ47168.1 amino acid adenylation domain-containing protein [Phycisphaerae bacterium]